MIKQHCFTEEWLERFRQQRAHARIDKIILEKMIYALHLLERLKAHGLDFVFKGGTSLVLLLEKGNRFSIDIDIVCTTSRAALEEIIEKVIGDSNFEGYSLDDHRSYQGGVPKAHYKFSFASKHHRSGTILLDVLFEDVVYPEVIEKPIASKWIETEDAVLVKLPSIESITGDKLTAFAPNTIGIPYFKGKEGRRQSFAMEICKQLYDLNNLFDLCNNMPVIARSYELFAAKEIQYRGGSGINTVALTPEQVLQDTIDTCVILAKRGNGTDDEKAKFTELQKGIKAFGGFLMEGNFRIDEAIGASARVAYLSAKILTGDISAVEKYQDQDIKDLIIEDPSWNFLNRLKKFPDKSAFYYWYQTVQLLMHNTQGMTTQ